MIDRERLQSAIAYTILPYAKDTASNDEDTSGEEGEDHMNDPFVMETATYISQEVIDSGLDIDEEQADLDDEDLENLPLYHILSPLLTEFLSTSNPLPIISNIIQVYFTPEPEPQHRHIRNGPCEVPPAFHSLARCACKLTGQLCERYMPLTFHHLIPRSTHRTLLKRHIFTRAEMSHRGASICRSCHNAIHNLYDNKTLAMELNTVEKLLEQEPVQRFCAWKSKQRGK